METKLRQLKCPKDLPTLEKIRRKLFLGFEMFAVAGNVIIRSLQFPNYSEKLKIFAPPGVVSVSLRSQTCDFSNGIISQT